MAVIEARETEDAAPIHSAGRQYDQVCQKMLEAMAILGLEDPPEITERAQDLYGRGLGPAVRIRRGVGRLRRRGP
jgi:hypothetical protein